MSSDDTISITIRKKWLYALVGMAVGFASGYSAAHVAAPGEATAPTAAGIGGPAPAGGARVDVDITDRPARGNRDAPVTVVEFTDYQCGYCGRHHRETKDALLERYGDRLRYVVLNFPLRNIHPEAQKAAEAAACAGDQGAFFPYTDILYRNQSELDPEDLLVYAGALDLDMDRFSRCLESGEKADRVEADVQEGLRHGVRSTPTFFVNGRRLVGAQPLASFRTAIDAELAATR